jgi:hypothetical protein
MEILFIHEDAVHALRPSSYIYIFKLHANHKLLTTLVGFFENEDHFGSTLKFCAGDNEQILAIVEGMDKEDYFDRRSCTVAQNPSKYYGVQALPNYVPFWRQ